MTQRDPDLTALARRFAGLDIQYRRDLPTGWSGHWRVRQVVSKNERAEYRLEAFGATWTEAVTALLAKLSEVDVR